jgi:hypothetical protein
MREDMDVRVLAGGACALNAINARVGKDRKMFANFLLALRMIGVIVHPRLNHVRREPRIRSRPEGHGL